MTRTAGSERAKLTMAHVGFQGVFPSIRAITTIPLTGSGYGRSTSRVTSWHPPMINIKNLIDDAKCFETVRQLRWPNGVTCPRCTSQHVTKNGSDETQPHRQRYRCQNGHRGFDDLTETIFAGHHQSLSTWILCLYFMGLNLSNQQIAAELDLGVSDVQEMTSQLREGIVVHRPEVQLSGTVECDEAYVVAGHKD